MSNEQGVWIREEEVTELLSIADAIDVLADAYRLQARGEATSMRRAHTRVGESILHAVGGSIAGLGVTGTKTWTFTPGGAAPLLVLFSLEDGKVLAVIEAFALGQMRTAATSGLGTRLLSRSDSRTLALLGTGKQAFSQAKAMLSVRPIDQIRVFGRQAEKRGAMAARLRDELGVAVSEHGDVAAAMDGADIVTAITRAQEPFVAAAALQPGMHVNAVGSIVASRRELDESAVGRCDVIVCDSAEQARDDSGELRAAVSVGLLNWGQVRGLDEIIGESPAMLRRDPDISLFKALGVGLSDVALGAEILRRQQGTGSTAEPPARVANH